MMNAAGDRRLVPDRRSNRDASIHLLADDVTNHLARPGIQHGRQIDEGARDGDLYQVRDPELVRAIGNEILGQVRHDHETSEKDDKIGCDIHPRLKGQHISPPSIRRKQTFSNCPNKIGCVLICWTVRLGQKGPHKEALWLLTTTLSNCGCRPSIQSCRLGRTRRAVRTTCHCLQPVIPAGARFRRVRASGWSRPSS